MRTRFLALPILALLAVSSLAFVVPASESAALTVHTPKKDGEEEITINFKKGDLNDTLSVSEIEIKGKQNEDDEDYTSPAEKAALFAQAINDAATAQGKPISATSSFNTVVVGCPGGDITAFNPTNHTREKDIVLLSPEEGEIAQAAFEFHGPAGGVGFDGEPSVVTIGAGSIERSFNITPGMSVSDLRRQVRQNFDGLGFRTSEAGTAVLIVLPTANPRASLDYNDATLDVSVGISVF